MDHIEAWSTNEITINWNSALAWVLAFHDDYAQGDDGGSSSSSTPASSSSSSVSVSSSSQSSVSSTASSSSSSTPASSSSSSSSGTGESSSSANDDATGQQCNWYGTLYPLCEDIQSGWGWENSESCIAPSTCSSQPAPYGIEGDSASSEEGGASSSSEAASSSSAVSSSSASSSEDTDDSLASCEYLISNEWNSGYTGGIRISNTGTQPIDGWSVNWELGEGASVTNSWNVELSGSNPYTASDMGWNGSIQPGQSVEFGFQVSKGGSGSARVPEVTGEVCD